MRRRFRTTDPLLARAATLAPGTAGARACAPTRAGSIRPRESARDEDRRPWDLVVVGAGFGGLGAALRAAESGARVLVLEAQAYPGGCASTFQHGGARFESGATLFSGLAPDQLFGRWIAAHDLDVTVDPIDPLVTYRSPSLELPVARDRDAFVDALCGLPGAPERALRACFAYQRRVADRLWATLEDDAAWPPLAPRALSRRLAESADWLAVARSAGKSLDRVLSRFGLADFAPLRELWSAQCQITVQCDAARAEAPFALAALDYSWRGTGHVRGGIGVLATELCRAIERAGGAVRFRRRVRCVEPDDDGGWWVHTLGESVRARRLIANQVPRALDATIAAGVPRASRLARLAERLDDGWGACMLYLELDPDERDVPHHLQLVRDPARALVEGNHVFVSTSGAQDGERAAQRPGRTATMSTHVPLRRLRALPEAERGAYVREVQRAMRETLVRLAPEVDARVRRALPASPRTFERFTGRTHGVVGGTPRRVGLRQYLDVSNPPVADGLWMVGDTVFPGQSAYAAALGGARTAERALASMPSGAPRA